MRDRVAERLELAVDRRQRDGPFLDERFELGAISPQLLLGAIQLDEDADLGAHDRRHDRREDEVHRAKVVAAPHVGLGLVQRRHEDDRRELRAWPLTDQLRCLETVHDRHSHVEQDHGELVAEQLAQGVGARGRLHDDLI